MIENKQDRRVRDLIAGLFRSRRSAIGRDADVDLYRRIVSAARQPLFYAEWGVPDTTDGRREMIGLHAIMVMRRLRSGGADGALLTQRLFDLMFADLDRNFREQGVGDLSVGKHVKRAASTFLARYQSLDQALDNEDNKALNDVLRRNLFTTGVEPSKAQIQSLSDHLSKLDKRLAAVPVGAMIDGSSELNELQIATG